MKARNEHLLQVVLRSNLYLVSIDVVVILLSKQFSLTDVNDKDNDNDDECVLKDRQYQVTSRDSECETEIL